MTDIITTVTEKGIKVVDRRIFFFAEVNEDTALTLIELLQGFDFQDAKSIAERICMGVTNPSLDPIVLFINSPGGTASDTYAVVDVIKSMKAPTISVVMGMAASAATLISAACASRFITPSSSMMIHQHRGFGMGTAAELEGQATYSKRQHKQVVRFYVEHTKLTAKQVRKMLLGETWFSASEAIEVGLVDGIWGKPR